jgi:hypothetical protein
VCGTPGNLACAGGQHPETAFAPGMGACGGAVTWDQRNSLCAPGWGACSASQWVSLRQNATPVNNYWTNDNLGWSGSGPNSCEATTTGGNFCGTNDPMRVCGTNYDAHGNPCNWTGCGLNTTTNQYFGGCVGNATAGTLCCMTDPTVACAAGVAHAQAFAPGVVGCSGTVTWGLRNTLCGPHCAACTAAKYVQYAGAAPQYDYWLDDQLGGGGYGNNDCWASSDPYNYWCGNDTPMRLCVPGTNTDPLGNSCLLYGCGYNGTSPNLYFGGCWSWGNTTAGTLCCCDQ